MQNDKNGGRVRLKDIQNILLFEVFYIALALLCLVLDV
jgi:hypothetical protein